MPLSHLTRGEQNAWVERNSGNLLNYCLVPRHVLASACQQ